MKLTKAQARMHGQAAELLTRPHLDHAEKLFVLEHWREDAQHLTSTAGAFFTPWPLALDFALDVLGGGGRPARSLRILDLAAGIGTLSLACAARHEWDELNGAPPLELVCVELNADYVAAGRKIVPQARWVHGSVFHLPADLGRFDVVISNPPFGRLARDGSGPRYRGGEFEYHVIDVAAGLAAAGVFIVPVMSAGFSYSGRPCFTRNPSTKYQRFQRQTGIDLEAGCGIDTAAEGYGPWHAVSPQVEIVTAEFPDHAQATIDGLAASA